MPKMIEKVDRRLFDAALRAGSDSASLAAKHLANCRDLLEAMQRTLTLIETGRTTHAREVLEKAIFVGTKKLL
jgi:hypothetical protein